MKNYFKVLFIILVISITKIYSQCPCSDTWCVTDAVGLEIALLNAAVTTPPPTIIICNALPINLGEIDLSKFPLVVPKDVTIQGNYNFFNYNKGSNTGTTINLIYIT